MPSDKLIAQGRSHSKDPTQEHLRQHKEEWNEICTEFIASINAFKPRLIAFKRGLNGRADAKAGIPVSDIKQPLPSRIPSYLNALNGEFRRLTSVFQHLVEDSASIINEQTGYSRKRKQPNPRHASKIVGNSIIVEGSNKVTRFWSNLSSAFSSDDVTRHRLSLLKMAHELFMELIEMEDRAISSYDNIPDVIMAYRRVINKFEALKSSFIRFEQLFTLNQKAIDEKSSNDNEKTQNQEEKTNSVEQTPTASEEHNNTLSNKKDPINLISEEDIVDPNSEPSVLKKNMQNLFKDKKITNEVRIFNQLFSSWYQATGSTNRKNLAAKLKQTYIEIVKSLVKEASLNEEGFIKEATSNYLARLLKYYGRKIGPKKIQTATRLDIYHDVQKNKKYTDRLMDLLEHKNFNIEDIKLEIVNIGIALKSIRERIEILKSLYKDVYYSDNDKRPDLENKYLKRLMLMESRRP